MEEVWAWKFDDDIQEENPNAFKFLQMARAWKASAHKGDKKDAMDEDDSDESDEDESEDDEAGPSKPPADSDDDESE